MAVNRATYLEGIRSILRLALQADGRKCWFPLLRAGVAWVKAGSTGAERSERRTFLRALICAGAPLVYGRVLSAHALGKELYQARSEETDAETAYADIEDVPDTAEPQV